MARISTLVAFLLAFGVAAIALLGASFRSGDALVAILTSGWLALPSAAATLVLWHLWPWLRSSMLGCMVTSAALGFAATVHGLLILVSLAWAFDWGRTATGSSTAGHGLLIFPLGACVYGMVGAVIGALVGAIVRGNMVVRSG